MGRSDKKTHKGYRLSQRTLREIDWLADRLDTTATGVIEQAVHELYEKTRDSLRARLILGEDGWYYYVVDDLPLAAVQEDALQYLGGYRDRLLSEEGSEDVFTLLVLAAHKARCGLKIHDENLERLAGPEVYERIEQWEAEEAAEEAATPAG